MLRCDSTHAQLARTHARTKVRSKPPSCHPSDGAWVLASAERFHVRSAQPRTQSQRPVHNRAIPFGRRYVPGCLRIEAAQVHFVRGRRMRLRRAEALMTLRLVAVASSKAGRDSYTGISMALSVCLCLSQDIDCERDSVDVPAAGGPQNSVLLLLRAPSCPCQAEEAAAGRHVSEAKGWDEWRLTRMATASSSSSQKCWDEWRLLRMATASSSSRSTSSAPAPRLHQPLLIAALRYCLLATNDPSSISSSMRDRFGVLWCRAWPPLGLSQLSRFSTRRSLHAAPQAPVPNPVQS